MVNRERVVEEFLELVQIPSHSGKEGRIAQGRAGKGPVAGPGG